MKLFDVASQVASFREYTIQSLPQLHYVIERSPHISKIFSDHFWNEIDAPLAFDGIKISVVETSIFAVVSNLILNRGYRVIAECQSTSTLLVLEKIQVMVSKR